MAFQSDSIFWVEVEKIVANPYQPRREFDQARLDELAESIRMYGVLQPLTVTRKEIQREDGSFRTEYELIAGERRLRASRLAEISLVPVIIREGDDNEQEKLELAIIENLQREDLNAIDRALAFKQLADSFKLTHKQVAKKVGRSREFVANSIRLLLLPETILDALRKGELSEGHARTLLMLNDKPEEQDTVFREILLKKLSVREAERISRSIAKEKIRNKEKYYDPEILDLEKKFTETLGTRVQIQKTEFGGKLTIDYFSPEDLTYMLNRMKEDAVQEQSARRPFSPPDKLAQKIESKETDEQMAKLDEATPLSALIAQLEQAEEQSNTAVGQEKGDNQEIKIYEYQSETSTILPSNTDEEKTFSDPKENDSSNLESPVDTVTEYNDKTEFSNQDYTKSADGETVRLPRVVRVVPEYTTAIYVAQNPNQEPDPTEEKSAEPAAPFEVDLGNPKESESKEDESDLYSIRNFGI